MKKAVFLVTHIGSQGDQLCQIINKNNRVQYCNLNIIYDHPFALDSLFEQSHKINNSAALWLQDLVYNYQFSNKSLYKFCKFIYFIRDGRHTLFESVKQENLAEPFIRYYCYRLRRIFEMARKTPKAIFLTWEDLVKGRIKELESFLRLKEPLNFSLEEFKYKKYNPLLNSRQIEEAESAYERYYTKFRLIFGLTK